MKKTIIALLMFNIFNANAQLIDPPIGDGGGQEEQTFVTKYIPNVTPSEVEAFKFRTYGNISANLASGTPEVSIPLYTLQDKGVSIPIVLNYDATGIKTNDISGPIGLKWSLSAGGTVDRTINTKADDGPAGWLTFIQNEDMNNLHTFLSSRFSDYRDKDSKSVRFVQRVIAEYDYSPDHYSIRGPGIRGNFSFDQQANPSFMERATAYKLSFHLSKKEFELRDQRGIKFHFGNNNIDSYYNTNASASSQVGFTGGNKSVVTMNGGGPGTVGVTSFLLDKIQTSNNQQLFKFSYNAQHEYSVVNYKAGYAYKKPVPLQEGDCPFAQEKMLQIRGNSFTTNLVTTVEGRKERVDFIYETLSGKDTQKRLREVIIKSKVTGTVITKIELQYLNYTGSNKYGLQRILFKNKNNIVNNQYSFVYQAGELPNADSNAKDINGYYNGATNNQLYYIDQDFFNYPGASDYSGIPQINGNRKVHPTKIKHGILKEIIYPTGGKTRFEYYIPNYSAMTTTSGLFLRSTYDLDETGKKKFHKRYSYSKLGITNTAPTGELDIISSGLSPNCPNSYWFTDDITDDRNRRDFNKITVEVFNENDQLQWSEEHEYTWAYDFPYLTKSNTFSPQKELLQNNTYLLDKTLAIKGYVAGETTERNNRYSMRVDGKNYPSIFYRKVKETFINNSELEKITEYEYDNRYLLNQTVSHTSISEEKNINKTYYPYSPGVSIASSVKNKMLDLNMLTPIKTESLTIHNTTTISEDAEIFNYKEWGFNQILPESIVYSKAGDHIDDSRVSFYAYNSIGDPLEVGQTQGVNIIYIWGYNDTYPIAKITNATYTGMPSDVTTLINQIRAASNIENTVTAENNIRAQFDALRAKPFFKNAQITSYTYDPLIGVTSMTDPRGYTMTYHYDAFNRLEQVKDQQGNILSENEYHYKNN